MDNVKYLIIGGGIAGTSAAEAIRNFDASGSIAIVSDEPHRLYSRVLLSKPVFCLGKIPFEKIWLRTDSWYKENNIDLVAGKKAVGLDSFKNIVLLEDGAKLHYEKLLLATGSGSRQLDVPGSDKTGIFVLRTLDDTKKIIEKTKTAKSAAVIGSGFIAFEMCDILRQLGIDVTLFMRRSRFWQSLLDEKSGEIIEKALEANGVKILKNSEIEKFLGGDNISGIRLKDGREFFCDMSIAGIGNSYDMEWIKSGGVKVENGVITNEYLETNVSNIWAAGDIAEFYNTVFGEFNHFNNWSNAMMQGKIAGLNMVGHRSVFRLVSSYTTSGFGIIIAFVGNVAHDARNEFRNYSSKIDSCARLVLRDGRIVGAVLINEMKELSKISKLIEDGEGVETFGA